MGGYRGFRITGGLNRKASDDAIADGELRTATACSYDEQGAVSSARGRQKANNDGTLGGSGSLLGGFDGLAGASPTALAKYRFLKRGSAVYTNATTSTALDDSTNLTATYTTSAGTLVNARKGLTAPTWGSSSMLSGFCYGGYAYLADGSAIQRLRLATGAPPTVTAEAWGLVAPGYHEITVDGWLACNNSTTVTATITGGHALGFGVAASPAYDGSAKFLQNIEIVGAKSIKVVATGLDVIPDNEINCLHYGGSGASTGDILVTSSGGLMSAGATYTVTYRNGAGSFNWSALNPQSPTGSGHAGLSNTLQVSTSTQGDPTTATDEVQTMAYQGGSATSGYVRLKASRGGGDFEITDDIAYNATAAQFQAALEALSFFNAAAGAATSVCTVNAATTFTFTVATTPTGGALTGGGTAAFIRQGPTLTESTGGALVGGTYYYAYTFFNGALDGSRPGAESNFSAQVPIYVATGASVNLTNVLMGPVGTTARRIYRTDVDGRQLYLVGQIENNTDTFFTDTARLAHGAEYFAQPGDAVSDAEFPAADQDQQARGKRASKRGVRESQNSAKAKDEKLRQQLATNLGLLADWVDHDAPPSDLKEVGLLGDTVFGISGSLLCFSRPAEPEHWPLGNRISPGRNTSETLRQWLGFDGACIAYTNNGLFRLSPVSLDFGESRFEEIESPVGLAGARAVAALDGTAGHVFLAKNGIYLFDGARVIEISYAIEPLLTDSTNANYVNPLYMGSAIMATSRDRVFMAYATTSNGNDRLLIGDFENPTAPKWTVIPWALSSMWRERGDTYLMAGDASGYLYVLDQGYTDDGAAIAWEIGTKSYRFNGQTMVVFDEVIVDGDFAGATTTIYAYVQSRNGNYFEATFTETDTAYPYRRRYKYKLPVHFKGEFIAVNVSSTHAGKRQVAEVGFTSDKFEDQP